MADPDSPPQAPILLVGRGSGSSLKASQRLGLGPILDLQRQNVAEPWSMVRHTAYPPHPTRLGSALARHTGSRGPTMDLGTYFW
jgi:hypothetical protein